MEVTLPTEENTVFSSDVEIEGDPYLAAYTSEGQWFLKTGEAQWDHVSNGTWMASLEQIRNGAGDDTVESSELADLVKQTADEIGDSVDGTGSPAVEAEADNVQNDEVIPDEEEVVVPPSSAQNTDPEDYDPNNDPFVNGLPAPGPVAPVVVETPAEPVDVSAVFAEAAEASQTEAPVTPSAVEGPPQAQKMAEVAAFLGKEELPASAVSHDSAICPVCTKVVLPGLAKKCRELGQIPMHPGCTINPK
jgi:hypothetical protein